MSRPPALRKSVRGQSLVEFALVLPVFLLVFCGAIDGARLIYANNQLSEAAREGARLAATEAPAMGSADAACVTSASAITAANPGARVCPPNSTALKADVVTAVNGMMVFLGPATEVHLACNAGAAAGDPAPTGAWTESTVTHPSCSAGSSGSSPNAAGQLVSVRVVNTFSPITPLAGPVFGDLTLSGSATMVIH
jgi:Flp pilus assembly protein TadG